MQEMMIEPAIRGTRYVMAAAADAGVKRVVFTSSIGTVYMNPYRDPSKPVDDTCWSDLEYCKNTQVRVHACKGDASCMRAVHIHPSPCMYVPRFFALKRASRMRQLMIYIES